ncbi:hypothetical protein [Streptomyces hypolithicus]
MISEPELVGGLPIGEPPETLTGERAPSSPRGRRPWLWAAGGALCASALWAGGLYAAGSEPGVDTRGYTVGEGLCEKAELAALGLSLGKRSRSYEPFEVTTEHAALDTATCTVSFVPTKPPKKGWMVTYEVQLAAELHKKADPEPEFEALASRPDWGNALSPQPQEVPGLGDRALLIPPAAEYEGPTLKVLDGGAVLEIKVTPGTESNGGEDQTDEEPPQPDLSALPSLMAEDIRDLMAALKR